MKKKEAIVYFCFLVLGCQDVVEPKLFQKIPAEQSGVDFINQIENTDAFNIFNYRNFYNGGGVGLGDINNDGWIDIYFTANQGSNKLYLNNSDFTFTDITESAGVAEAQKWSTGVSIVDINADGWLDIYVCNAGYQTGVDQKNSLFINNGDLTFTEQAANYNLDHNGYTTHTAFFDYDKDGDLDAYVLNNSFIPVNTLNYANKRELNAEDWPVKDFLRGGGDVLLKNKEGKFEDVTETAGIYSSLIGFGLGVTVGDVNNDNWDDLYISNDFFERDYLYINQQDGTFSEELEQRIGHTSLSSMGADMADLNNDGHLEIYVTDMLPNEEYRLKTTSSYENIDVFNLKKERGFYNQFMQNTLQLNDGKGHFSEIAYHAKVQASDWSWGALLFDADNDAFTDIFICNGILNDVIDQDFIDFFADDVIQKMVLSGNKEKMSAIVDKMPSMPIENVMFKNQGYFKDGLEFEQVSTDWGLDDQTFSNGAAYGDLDNDGDLDLVVSNVNQQALVYRNSSANNFIQLQLQFEAPNINAIGAKVKAYYDGTIVPVKSIHPYKGFQSTVENKITFGIPKHMENAPTIKITWPNQEVQIVSNLPLNELTTIIYNPKNIEPQLNKVNAPNFYKPATNTKFDKHEEDDYLDFYYERNIPELLSKEGPSYAKADVNGDGLEDIYIGGAAGQTGQLYLNAKTGFKKQPQAIFEKLKAFEETAALLFDADNDRDVDLYFGTGGNHLQAESRGLNDFLLLNDGKGNFELARNAIPNFSNNTSVVKAHDFDKDGDLDLFVGSRNYPKEYGVPPFSFILVNNGKAQFEYFTKLRGGLQNFSGIGMVTDAAWANVYGDDGLELIVIGDWLAPTIYQFQDTAFVEVSTNLEDKLGFWRALETYDINRDGYDDLLLGNIGTNFSLSFDSLHPLQLYINDFDGNGFADKVLTKTIDGKAVPVMLKREMADQFAFIKKKNLKHSEYAKQSIRDILDVKALESAIKKEVNYPYSIIAYGNETGNFIIKKLPNKAQFSCMNDFCVFPFEDATAFHIYAGGNNFNYLPQLGRLDACKGLDIQTDNHIWGIETLEMLKLNGQLRHIDVVYVNQLPHLLIIENDRKPNLYQIDLSLKEP